MVGVRTAIMCEEHADSTEHTVHISSSNKRSSLFWSIVLEMLVLCGIHLVLTLEWIAFLSGQIQVHVFRGITKM